jgi:CheY-like chemotaxis protein
MNIALWLRDATSVFKNALSVKDLQLTLNVSEMVPEILRTDGNRLRQVSVCKRSCCNLSGKVSCLSPSCFQVLSNFLSNAIKFSTKGSPVSITVTVTCHNATCALLTGIQDEQYETVFDLPSTQRRPASTAVSQEILAIESESPARQHDTNAAAKHSLLCNGSPGDLADSKSAPFLRISVTDSGPGIATHEIPLLFQPYVQLRAGELQKGMGTGLGLAVCKSTIELMGGNVGVTSTLGEGATFWLEIPLDVPTDAVSATATSMNSVQLDYRSAAIGGAKSLLVTRSFHELRGADGSGIGIVTARPGEEVVSARPALSGVDHADVAIFEEPPLELQEAVRAVVVDDVRSNRELFARLVRRNGAEVVFTAEHGLDCLEKLSGLIRQANQSPLAVAPLASDLQGNSESGLDRYAVTLDGDTSALPPVLQLTGADSLVDLWFVDGNMPVMGGIELTKRLRSAGVQAPIIAVTGNTLVEDQAEFLEAGVSAVLSKPCTVAKLHEVLERVGIRLPHAPQ